MGTVYVANDRLLGRAVALKVLHGPDPGPEATARMLREARIIARLEHPGIVPVHDVGTLADGRIFYAMKLVRGRRLDEHLREGCPLAERLRIFERICEAVAFAHAHGVIHRDLKPENVMVGAFGEVLVMDWGVARWQAEGEERGPSAPAPADAPGGEAGTAHGTILGTPGYMAPEQARGEAVDQRADIYALGAILHFLLSSQPPRRAVGSPSEGSTWTRPGPGGPLPAVEPPRRLRKDTPRPLEAICLKALACAPADRYATVTDLARDVASFLAGGRVAAYPEGPLQRAHRFYRKYRTPILLILAYLLMRTVLLVFART
jgi:serine/threonine protein kinase